MPDGSLSITPTWRDAIRPGDILLFHYPAVEDGGAAVEPRPCLVIETPVIDGDVYVELAYGTTAMAKAHAGHEVRLRKPADHRRAGLDAPTRFLAAHRLKVPLTHRGFVDHGITGTPVVGRLSGPTRARMNAVRTRLAEDAARSRRRRERAAPRRHNPEINSGDIRCADRRYDQEGSAQ